MSGKLSAGADCANTLKPGGRSMTLTEFIEFLEPSPAIGDKPEKGPAICQSSDDWNKLKTALEQACALLKDQCTYEMQEWLLKANEILLRFNKKSIESESIIK